jgi:hypothetical protein
LEVLAPRYNQIYKISCGKTLNKRQYELTIGNFLAYTCMDFVYDFELIGEMREMGAM